MIINARVATNLVSWDVGYRFTDEALASLVKDAPGKDIVIPTPSADAHIGKIISAKLVEKGALKYVEVTASIELWLVTRGVSEESTDNVKDGIASINKLLMPRFLLSPEPDVDDGEQPTIENGK